MTQRMPSPTPTQSEISSPDSSGEKPSTEQAVVSTTIAQMASSGPAVSRRDPRLQPKDSSQPVEHSMPPDHSVVAAGTLLSSSFLQVF